MSRKVALYYKYDIRMGDDFIVLFFFSNLYQVNFEGRFSFVKLYGISEFTHVLGKPSNLTQIRNSDQVWKFDFFNNR